MIPETRIVLLGASNLSRTFAIAVEMLRATFAPPLEILCAKGAGRSYGIESRFVARRMGSIGASELWNVLARAPRVPTFALVSDLGNDLAYGQAVDAIAGWIERDLTRLRALDARCALVRLPIESIDKLGPLRFHVARSLIFPGRPLELEAVQRAARELDQRALELARRFGAQTIEPQARWFGLDPIHVKRSAARALWSAILAAWDATPRRRQSARWSERWQLAGLRPLESRILGLRRSVAQPGVRLHDGTEISWY